MDNRSPELLGHLPDDWKAVRLDSIADLVSGGTPSKTRTEWWSGSIPWASPKDMKKFRLRETEDHISEDGLRNGSRLVPANTVFVVIRGMILSRDVPVALAELPMAFNQDMKALIPNEAVDPEYLLYALASQKSALAKEIGTSAHGTRRMGTSSLSELLVPLPPKGEQRALAAILSKLERAMEVQERVVATLKELKAATMAKLFREGLHGEAIKETEIGEMPESWEVVRVGELVTLSSGRSRPADMSSSRNEGKPFPVYGGNGVMGYSSRSLTSKEALVIGRVGAYCGSVHVCPRQSWVTDNALYHRNPVGDEATLHFLAELLAYLNLNRLHRQGAQPLITQGSVHALRIPLPRIPEQEAIASTAERIGERIAVAEEGLGSLRMLFSSMLQLLMIGQIRAKDAVTGGVEGTVQQTGPNGMDALQVRIQRFVAELVRRFEPERVILFGQHAEGSPRAFGAVGLLVEMEFEGLKRDQAARIAHEIPRDFSLDLVVRRPEDIERAGEIGDPFITGILERGRALYHRPDAPLRRERASPKPRPPRQGRVSEETLREIVHQIVGIVQPEQVILFGSAARGEMGPDSDVDLLVVKACIDRREVAQMIRERLIGVAPGLPKDVIVVTPEDVERYRETIGLIIRPALREGRVVYAA